MTYQPHASRRLTATELDWFRAQRVNLFDLVRPSVIYAVNGACNGKGRFREEMAGERWFAIPEDVDDDGEAVETCYWNPATQQIAVATGSAFCLGQWRIASASTYALDGNLQLCASPLAWLQGKRQGIFVLHWEWCFDYLRDCPRILLSPDLVAVYRKHMHPRNLPVVRVIQDMKL